MVSEGSVECGLEVGLDGIGVSKLPCRSRK